MKSFFHRFRRPLAVSLVASFLVGAMPASPAWAAAPPSAQVKEEAQRHFKRGIELFEEDNFRAALIEFERAYKVLPNPQVLYNIGQVHFQLQEYVLALKAFERFLAEGGATASADRKAEVEREIAKLRSRVASVEVTTTAGATIFVDGTAIGEAPLTSPVQVSSGRRTVRATLAGRDPVEKVIELAGGDAAKIELTFEAATTAATAQGPSSEPPVGAAPAEAASSSPPWALWGVAGALLAGTAVTGIVALGASGDAKDIRANGGTLADYDSAQSRMKTFGVVTDILGIATILTAGVATYFTVTSGKKTGAGASVVRVGVTPGGASIVGTF